MPLAPPATDAAVRQQTIIKQQVATIARLAAANATLVQELTDANAHAEEMSTIGQGLVEQNERDQRNLAQARADLAAAERSIAQNQRICTATDKRHVDIFRMMARSKDNTPPRWALGL